MPNANVPINIAVTFRQTDSSESLKKYATEKLTSVLKKYVRYETEVKVVLSVQKRDHLAEVLVHSKGFDASGSATTDDLYSAIDKVIDTVSEQLRRQKDKSVKHHKVKQELL